MNAHRIANPPFHPAKSIVLAADHPKTNRERTANVAITATRAATSKAGCAGPSRGIAGLGRREDHRAVTRADDAGHADRIGG